MSSSRQTEITDISGVYINSLALQAVLEQWTANGGQDYNPQNPGASSTSLVGSYKRNEYYIKEVIDASRSLLRHVVNGLFPEDNLKHAPVRTHMRILSGAMFLLKVGSSSFLNSPSNNCRPSRLEPKRTKSQPLCAYSTKPLKPFAPALSMTFISACGSLISSKA